MKYLKELSHKKKITIGEQDFAVTTSIRECHNSVILKNTVIISTPDAFCSFVISQDKKEDTVAVVEKADIALFTYEDKTTYNIFDLFKYIADTLKLDALPNELIEIISANITLRKVMQIAIIDVTNSLCRAADYDAMKCTWDDRDHDVHKEYNNLFKKWLDSYAGIANKYSSELRIFDRGNINDLPALNLEHDEKQPNAIMTISCSRDDKEKSTIYHIDISVDKEGVDPVKIFVMSIGTSQNCLVSILGTKYDLPNVYQAIDNMFVFGCKMQNIHPDVIPYMHIVHNQVIAIMSKFREKRFYTVDKCNEEKTLVAFLHHLHRDLSETFKTLV